MIEKLAGQSSQVIRLLQALQPEVGCRSASVASGPAAARRLACVQGHGIMLGAGQVRQRQHSHEDGGAVVWSVVVGAVTGKGQSHSID